MPLRLTTICWSPFVAFSGISYVDRRRSPNRRHIYVVDRAHVQMSSNELWLGRYLVLVVIEHLINDFILNRGWLQHCKEYFCCAIRIPRSTRGTPPESNESKKCPLPESNESSSHYEWDALPLSQEGNYRSFAAMTNYD